MVCIHNAGTSQVMETQRDTESKIFEAARTVFSRSGFSGARMQDIAELADINQSMLHYYFRSKELLFEKVYQKEMESFFRVIITLLEAEEPLDKKIRRVVAAYHEMWKKNIYLFSFVTMEMNRHPDRIRSFVAKNFSIPTAFKDQVERAVAHGIIIPIEPRQLLINTIGLVLFPFLGRLMIETIYQMTPAEFDAFVERRKEEVPEFILRAINFKHHD